jgi:DNA repair protein RecN (Recombination protein N)
MLETLRIENYALIESLEVDFERGFNVLTGETGAGKSIIVGALNLVLGARASSDVVRTGAAKAKIDAIFRCGQVIERLGKLLEEHDIEIDGDELHLSRVVSEGGRSRAYIAGSLVPIGILARIGDELVDLHGQHEHQSLLRVEQQLDLLDAFAGARGDSAIVAEAVARLRDVERRIHGLETDDREKARQIEFLKFEVSEIDKAALIQGEEEELRGRRTRITNAETIFEAARRAYTALYERDESSATDATGEAAGALEELAAVDAEFQPLLEQLARVQAELEAVAAEIRQYTDEIEYDPEELNALNQRLAIIGDLKRKYGDSIEVILAYREKAAEEIASFEERDERLAALQAEREELSAAALLKAKKLSSKRKKAAQKLDKRVAEALQDLGMRGSRFATRVEASELSSTGLDAMEFMLAANHGEDLKPLRQVASGGEISRVMLALKSVFAEADRIPTLIFDEIDAGVGGETATKVASKLQGLAESHQVLCITHLPQIAAAAPTHFNVSKSTRKDRTVTEVTKIEQDTRIEELARLLDGSVSNVSLEHARSLLASR